ncbi:MAG: histidine phosphatase family protein [Herpetosiphonaceae bacterium]|nr:histidine phosphatase family protein [Herpetosiphonaceae bacterium]
MTGVQAHTVVWLVRHGQTDWNRERRYLSYTNRPLTPFGLARAEAMGWMLRRFAISAVINAGLEHTRQTAAAVLHQQAYPVSISDDARWAEAHYGRWEGLTYPEVSHRFATEATARFADPWQYAPQGGEPLMIVQERVRAAWHDLVREHSGGKVLVVAHATPLQLILADLLGYDPQRYWQVRLELGSVTTIDLYPSAAILRMLNCLPPLRHA